MIDTTESMTNAALSSIFLRTNLDRLRGVVLALQGMYEERQGEKAYNMLGDDSL